MNLYKNYLFFKKVNRNYFKSFLNYHLSVPQMKSLSKPIFSILLLFINFFIIFFFIITCKIKRFRNIRIYFYILNNKNFYNNVISCNFTF